MGTTSSSLSELHNNEHLLRFVGKESISNNDPFWNQLLSFTFSPPKTSSDSQLLEESIHSLLESLLINNLHTGNLGSLVKVFLARAVELKTSAQCENSIFTWQTYNALFILRCIIKYFVQTESEEGLVKHLAIKSPASQETENGILLELLITTLVEIIVDVPVLDFTYPVHLEAVNTMLVLLSIQMFSMRPPNKSNVYKCLMHGKSSIHSFLLTKTLLYHFTKQEKPPNSINDSGGSIILGLASGIWNVLTFGYGNRSTAVTEGDKKDKEMTLANQSLLMLLILVNHCTNDKGRPNPYREGLFSFGNIQDPSSTQNDTIPAFKLDYSKLFESICSTLQDDQTTLLLYLLLHRNCFFKNYVLSRTDCEALVVPILKILYQAQERSSHLIYMTLIILLILSEDDLYNESVHDIPLKNIAWYTERMISEISLGGLLVLVVIRTIQYNMTRTRDKYLHTNCLAALANMSSHFKNLHPYVCQRFVSLFENLAKRLTRVVDQLRNNGESTKSDSDDELSTDLMYDLSVLEEVLRMVLEIINCTLTTQLQHNPNLLYTLLYKRHVFEAFRSHPNFQDIIQNLDMVLTYFSSHLEAANQNPSVGEVLKTIQQSALQWPQDKLRKFPELKFKYVEEEQPEEFFIPYIWSLVYNSSSIYWNPQNIILFNPNKGIGS